MKTEHPLILSVAALALSLLIAAPVSAQIPVVTAPGAVTAERRPEFTWSATPGATWYRVWVGVETGMEGEEYDRYADEWTQLTAWSPDWDIPSGHYIVWIRAWGPTVPRTSWSAPHPFDRVNPEIVSSVDGVVNDGGDIDLVAGTNITITPDDVSNTITIASSGGAPYTAAVPLNVSPGRVVGLNPASLEGDVLTWNSSSNHWMAARPGHLAVTPETKDNTQPFLAVQFIIATQGVFPSRNGVDPFLAEITMFGGNFAPRGWAFCNGQLLGIADNSALFSLIGTIYGGDGRTSFALPDLRGRVPMHAGTGNGLTTRAQGTRGGTESISTHRH